MDPSKIAKNSILESLNFNQIVSEPSEKEKIQLICMLCEFSSENDWSDNKEILQHMYYQHRLVIADVQNIANLREYLRFWKNEFKDKPLEEYCTTLLWKQLPDGTKTEHDEKYYLLSDVLPKEKKLRDDIQRSTIERALERHQFERMDTNYIRGCLYCRSPLDPTRYQYVEHLYTKHFLQLGKAENLVFIDELIDFIENKLSNLVCIYCEKIFKDRSVLKEHMRKKGHKRINPENKAYDRFFMVNYKMDKLKPKHQERKFYNPKATVQEMQQNLQSKSVEPSIFNSDDSDWSEWEDRDQKIEIICLFCQYKEIEFDHVKQHMRECHQFHFDAISEHLNFYQKVKITNYIRRKIHLKQCLKCDEGFEDLETLLAHMKEMKHFSCDGSSYEKPEYFFPTFEDDSFLCHLDNITDDDEMSDDSGAVIISEDQILHVNKSAEMLSREKFIEM